MSSLICGVDICACRRTSNASATRLRFPKTLTVRVLKNCGAALPADLPRDLRQPPVAKLARENGINANILFIWRRRYLAEQQTRSAGLIPVVLVSDTPAEVAAPSLEEARAQDTKPVATAGTIEIQIGRAVVKLDGVVDADILRIVLGSLRS